MCVNTINEIEQNGKPTLHIKQHNSHAKLIFPKSTLKADENYNNQSDC